MLVSVIMPVKNGENHIAEAIKSVQDQQLHDIELIIINDASTDQTLQIVEASRDHLDFSIRLLHAEGIGPAGARNRGLDIAQGEYITFLDHDDLWPQGRLQRHVEFLKENPELGGVIGLVDTQGPSEERLRQAYVTPETTVRFKPNMGACTFTKSALAIAGTFDAELLYGEDTDFIMKTLDHGIKALYLEEVALIYRLHDSNMTFKPIAPRTSFFSLARRSIQRKKMMKLNGEIIC